MAKRSILDADTDRPIAADPPADPSPLSSAAATAPGPNPLPTPQTPRQRQPRDQAPPPSWFTDRLTWYSQNRRAAIRELLAGVGRERPAPQAVADETRWWADLRAELNQVADPEVAVAQIEQQLGVAYDRLDGAGAPPVGAADGSAQDDLPATHPDRVRFDRAILAVVRLNGALENAWARGGAWRAAVEHRP